MRPTWRRGTLLLSEDYPSDWFSIRIMYASTRMKRRKTLRPVRFDWLSFQLLFRIVPLAIIRSQQWQTSPGSWKRRNTSRTGQIRVHESQRRWACFSSAPCFGDKLTAKFWFLLYQNCTKIELNQKINNHKPIFGHFFMHSFFVNDTIELQK